MIFSVHSLLAVKSAVLRPSGSELDHSGGAVCGIAFRTLKAPWETPELSPHRETTEPAADRWSEMKRGNQIQCLISSNHWLLLIGGLDSKSPSHDCSLSYKNDNGSNSFRPLLNREFG